MKVWTVLGSRRAAVIGVVAGLGVVAAGGAVAVAYRDSHETVTEYAFDAPAAPIGGGWQCFGCKPPVDPRVVSRTAGVAARLPTDTAFRGIVLTSEAFPEGLRNARVMPDGYYLEFLDGTVRFVAEAAPWNSLAPDLEPVWTDYLVREGVIGQG